jgi:PH domain/leucine-rich repeat-containing protein phosphatase
MLSLRKLFILVLAFNRFTSLPPVVAQMTNVRTSEVENIIMAGNEIDHIPSETLMEMKYVKKVDLRMNQLTLNATETMKLTVLEHLTHLDIRDNQVTDLDLRSLRTLEYLNVERNDMVSLQANGMSMKTLFASHNCG